MTNNFIEKSIEVVIQDNKYGVFKGVKLIIWFNPKKDKIEAISVFENVKGIFTVETLAGDDTEYWAKYHKKSREELKRDLNVRKVKHSAL